MNRQLHGDRPEAEVVPASAEAIAQELFLFGLSDDGRAELERVVSSDFSRAQMTVKMASHSSDLVFQEIAAADDDGRRRPLPAAACVRARPAQASSSARSTTTW